MTRQEADDRLLDAYHEILSEELRLAHSALMEWASFANDDGWPLGRDVLRFARCYGVPVPALGGLVGLLPLRVGQRIVWVDAFREPELARRVCLGTFQRNAMVSFGIFCAAVDTLEREAAPS